MTITLIAKLPVMVLCLFAGLLHATAQQLPSTGVLRPDYQRLGQALIVTEPQTVTPQEEEVTGSLPVGSGSPLLWGTLEDLRWTPWLVFIVVVLWTLFLISGPYYIGRRPVEVAYTSASNKPSQQLQYVPPHVIDSRRTLNENQASRLMQLVLLRVAVDPNGISANQIDAVLLDLVPGFDKYRRALVDFYALGFASRIGPYHDVKGLHKPLVQEFASESGLKIKLAVWAAAAWSKAIAEATSTLKLKG